MSATSKAYRFAILVATTITVGASTAASSAMAQSNQKTPEALERAPKDRKAPLLLRIQAAQHELSVQQMTMTFTGNVRATLGDTTIRREILVAHYEQSAASAGARAVRTNLSATIVAIRSIHLSLSDCFSPSFRRIRRKRLQTYDMKSVIKTVLLA